MSYYLLKPPHNKISSKNLHIANFCFQDKELTKIRVFNFFEITLI